MMKILINHNIFCSFLKVNLDFLHASLETETKEVFFSNRWRYSKNAKGLIAFAIIAVMLVSFFAFLPKGNNSKLDIAPQTTNLPTESPIYHPTNSPTETPQVTINPTHEPDLSSRIMNSADNFDEELADDLSPEVSGILQTATTMNSSVWRVVAANAWGFFQPGIGIERTTGLPGSSEVFSAFTDWDLGVYIQAVIDAQKIGLIGSDGDWTSSARLEKVVRFLETRELNSTTHYPYWFYQSKDGKNYHANSDKAEVDVDVIDTGRLFVALNNLRLYNISLASRINNIVLYGQLYNRSDYAALVPDIKAESLSSNSIYFYYVAIGFASFWPNELSSAQTTILNNIFSDGNVTTYNVSLPKARITGDPLLCSFFEINNTDSRLQTLLNQVYLAHEAYYNSTGKYRAFSEGASQSGEWVWEWVVLPDGRTWVSLNGKDQNTNRPPMIYTKVSLSFLAVYNTSFAMNMSIYLEKNLPSPIYGFYDGVDESGAALTNGVYCNTNGLILDSALYAITHNP